MKTYKYLIWFIITIIICFALPGEVTEYDINLPFMGLVLVALGEIVKKLDEK